MLTASLLRQHSVPCEFVVERLGMISDELMRVGELLTQLLDLPAMFDEQRFIVKAGNGAALDNGECCCCP